MESIAIDWIFKILISVLSCILGWLIRKIWQDIDEMKKVCEMVTKNMYELELKSVATYVQKTDLANLTKSINSNFDKIDNRLDKILDKLENKQDRISNYAE